MSRLLGDCVLEPATTADWRGVECRNNMCRLVLACRVTNTFVGKELWEGGLGDSIYRQRDADSEGL